MKPSIKLSINCINCTNFLFAVGIFSTREHNTFYSQSEIFLFASRNIFSLSNKDNLLFHFLQTSHPLYLKHTGFQEIDDYEARHAHTIMTVYAQFYGEIRLVPDMMFDIVNRVFGSRLSRFRVYRRWDRRGALRRSLWIAAGGVWRLWRSRW